LYYPFIRKYLLRLIFILSSSSCGLVLSANSIDWQQVGTPISEHFDTLNVGNNPQNFTIKQDEKGFIYIGNGAGILIYDGVDWQNINYGEQQAFRDFELSKDGKIYTGTNGDLGFFSVDAKGFWKFKSLLAGDRNLPDITDVYNVLIMGQYIYYSSQSHFFYYHPAQGMRWVSQAIYPVDMIAEDGKVLISTQDKKLFHFDPILKTLEPVENNSSLEQPLISGFAAVEDSEILAYSRDKLFFKNNQSGLTLFETDIDQWLAKNTISYVTQMPDKNIAIATVRDGMAIITRKGNLQRFYNTNHGLKTNDINAVFVDRENNLWISSSSDGASRVELNSAISYFSNTDQHLLSAATVEFKNKIFVGALDGLFSLVPPKSSFYQAKFKKIDFDIELAMSFLADENELLVGHGNGVGSIRIDTENNYQYSILHDGRSQKGGHIRQITRSKLQPDIAYGASKNGILQLQKIDGKWQSRGMLKNFNERIYMLHEDPDGKLWLGANNGQFYYLEQLQNWPEARITPLDYPRANLPTMASTFILGEHSLFNNGVSDHIKTLSPDGSELVNANMVDWLEQEVSSIMLLQQNTSDHAWFSTWVDSLGFDRVGLLSHLGNYQYGIDFSPLDRLQLQFTLGLYETGNGILWVNSKGKIIRFDTRIDAFKSPLSPPVLSKLVEIGSDNLLYMNNQFELKPTIIRLQPEQNALRLHYTSAEYQHGETTEFRYQIKGVQDAWSEWRTKTSLEITNLDPGEHQLNLQYRVNPKAQSPVLNIILQRTPFWYQSWWGQTIILLTVFSLVFGMGVLIARKKNRQLIQKAKELKSQVLERTQLIQRQYDQLQKQNEQLQQVDEVKNRFFTNISHEFRTPLSLSIGPLKAVLAKDRIENQQDKTYLKLALKNNLHMMNLIGQVLDINKLEAKGMPVKITKLELVKNLQYCIQRFQHQAEKQKVQIKTVGFESESEIYFDADHFEKIILNLLSNAVKYSPPQSCIEVGMKTEDKNAIVWVKDQGAGIEFEDQAHIFNRFYQGKKSSHTIQPGTGIGLALVKELLDLHEAEIAVVSKPGEGSCFTVTLPTISQHYDSDLIAKNEYDMDSLTHTLNLQSAVDIKHINESVVISKRPDKTVLVIDDNEELRGFIRSILQSQYRIIEADNGRIGLQMALTEQPDVILSDVMMPVMDGFELAEKLKSSQQTDHIPLILLTAKSAKRDVVEGLYQGADDYLSKPFDSAELCARISAQIAHKKRVANQLIRQFKQQSEDELKSPSPVLKDKFTQQLNSLVQQKIDDESFDVDQMCQAMNTTRSTLFRNIKKRFDCTPKQLLKTRRLDLALQILKTHNGTVSEVAYAVGFQSLSSFSRAFNDYYQVPPTRFEEIVD